MTDAQLEKARRLRDEAGMENVSFEQGYIESLPFDVVVSNGVINLSAGKEHVFAEVRRVLRPAGRLALSVQTLTENEDNSIADLDVDVWGTSMGITQTEGYDPEETRETVAEFKQWADEHDCTLHSAFE